MSVVDFMHKYVKRINVGCHGFLKKIFFIIYNNKVINNYFSRCYCGLKNKKVEIKKIYWNYNIF